jgi:thiaminase (transcriptional activator TenA)
VLQDAIYLRDYARALSLAGAHSGDEKTLDLFNEHAAGTIAVERSLHEGLFGELGIARAEAEAAEPSPTTLAYASFLLKTAALRELPEALGALLPCYWVYWEVGKVLRERGSPDPLYRRWIETYAGEEFGPLVSAMLDLTDRACGELGAPQGTRVEDAFVTSSRYEWMFWDAAWRLEDWPVARPAAGRG